MSLKSKNIFSVFIFIVVISAIDCPAQKNLSSANAFIGNKGQILDQKYQPNNDVLFLYPGKGLNIQLRKNGFSYEFFANENKPVTTKNIVSTDLKGIHLKTHRVDLDFVNMNPEVEIITENKSRDYLNYSVEGKLISEVYSFRKITYKNAFPMIDIEFIITGNENSPLKYNIIIHPGGKIEDVKFLYHGGSEIKKTDNGEILISTSRGEIKESIPESFYKTIPSEKIKAEFILNENIISFSADYDKSKTIIIDPSSNRIWGTYYGNTGMDFCNSTGVDDQKNVYLSGYTQNTTNIATSGTYQSAFSGTFDAYLVKFDSDGNRLWGTYFGGVDIEAAYDIHVLPSGIVYMSGDSFSTTNVASIGAYQTVYGGGINDAYLAKFTTSGQLIWATYYGGSEHDVGQGVTVDSNGDVLMCGHTISTDGIGTAGALNENFLGIVDAYVVKFDSSGNRLWGTYFGNTDDEEAFDITTDPDNNVIITGYTLSLNGISTIGAHQDTNGGLQDAFIAKLNPAGNNLIWSTFYGGAGNDQGTSVAVDSSGTVFISGNTSSADNIVTFNAFQQLPGGADDAFLVRLDENGIRQWGTYFGGINVDYINELILDSDFDLIFCGSTISSDSICTDDAWQTDLGAPNLYDAFFAKFNRNGFPGVATYYGGNNDDHGRSIAIDNSGHIYLAGETKSTDSIASNGSFMTNWAGNDDGFLAKFCVAPEPVIISPADTICAGVSVVLSLTDNYFSYLWNNSTTQSTLIFNDTTSGNYFFYVTVSDESGCSADSDTTAIIVDYCDNIEEDAISAFIAVFPVPAGDFIHVNFQQTSVISENRIRIYSATGELIRLISFSSDHITLAISDLSPGIYFLFLELQNQVYSAKITKM